MLLLVTGAIGGALLASFISMIVWFAPIGSQDASRTLTDENSASSESAQRYPSSFISSKSGEPFVSGSSRTIDETFRLESDFDQTVALYTLLADADEERVLDLIQQAETLSYLHQRDSALYVIFSKYADIDPVRALSKAQEYGSHTRGQLIDRVFHQWAKNDLEAALTSAQSLSGEQQETASRSILNARDDLNLDRLYELAGELQDVEYRNKFLAKLWRAKAQEDPRTAWQSALESTSDISSMRLVLTTIAETWVEKEGLNALEEIKASTISEYLKMTIYQTVLGQVAETDIEEAVAVAAKLNLNPSGFSSSSRVVAKLFSKWAEKEPYQLFGLADSLDQRFVSIAKHQALAAIAHKSPQDAVALLAQVDNVALVRRISATIATQWALTDPKASLEWYMNDERGKHDPALRFIMQKMVEEDAHGAFKIVADYSGELRTLLTSSFFGILVNQTGVDATEFISLLDDDEKQIPLTTIGRRLARSDINQALELEKNLPESGRKKFRDNILSAAASPDPFYLFDRLDQLSGTELQSQAALLLLMRDKAEGLLSDEQLKNLRSRLDDDGHQKLDSVVVTGSYSHW